MGGKRQSEHAGTPGSSQKNPAYRSAYNRLSGDLWLREEMGISLSFIELGTLKLFLSFHMDIECMSICKFVLNLVIRGVHDECR